MPECSSHGAIWPFQVNWSLSVQTLGMRSCSMLEAGALVWTLCAYMHDPGKKKRENRKKQITPEEDCLSPSFSLSFPLSVSQFGAVTTLSHYPVTFRVSQICSVVVTPHRLWMIVRLPLLLILLVTAVDNHYFLHFVLHLYNSSQNYTHSTQQGASDCLLMYATQSFGRNINNLDNELRGASRYEFRVNEYGIVKLVAIHT